MLVLVRRALQAARLHSAAVATGETRAYQHGSGVSGTRPCDGADCRIDAVDDGGRVRSAIRSRLAYQSCFAHGVSQSWLATTTDDHTGKINGNWPCAV